ncbi:phage antirepressor [uncultured Mitsuokella sp.]|uniref:phage antirepressor n=1 Tax=uncultured Mitsuokella sp. TaxID=453120 RepID=UPI0025D53379|nr:phage antirepressor [uncultured Mitsuokella sp.]
MNELQIFNNPEFGEVRTTVIDGEPWFVGKDVAMALGYSNPSNAVVTHVDDEDKTTYSFQVSGSNYKSKATLINESGLYSLVLSSKLPTAKKFKRWVTSEVLPAIRKHGGYHIPQSPEEQMAQGLLAAQKLLAEKDTTIAKQTQLIGELKPKADYTDRILQSKSLVTITQIANDYGMSGAAMNEKLHELGVIYKLGGQWLLYSKYQAKGYTHSETVDITHRDGHADVKMNTKWTQKGRLFLYEFLKNKGILPIIEREQIDEGPVLKLVQGGGHDDGNGIASNHS